MIVSGPESAIRKKTELFVPLVPGSLKVSDVAKRLRRHFAEMVADEFRESIQAISLDEIIATLPPGSCDIEKP
jgi:hypothetical protein